MNDDLVEGEPEAIELELGRLVCVLGQTLAAESPRPGYGWGALLSLAAIEYLKDRGDDLAGLEGREQAELIG